MERIFIFVLIGGIVCIFFGVQEIVVSSGTTREAIPMELSDIEAGTEVRNNHVRIAEYWALYPALIYSYTQSKYSSAEPTDSTSVSFSYFPIVSSSHPFFEELFALEEKYGDTQNIPDEEWPDFKDFKVLVKTKQFATVGDFPDATEFIDTGIDGLFINKIQGLSSDERKLLADSFPDMDFKTIYILEQGRKPRSPIFSYGLAALGVLLIGVPIWLLIRHNKASKPATPGASTEPPAGPSSASDTGHSG